jgi:hypothetical protein
MQQVRPVRAQARDFVCDYLSHPPVVAARTIGRMVPLHRSRPHNGQMVSNPFRDFAGVVTCVYEKYRLMFY